MVVLRFVRMLGDSRSTLRHGCEVWTVKCPSIGSRISTCEWTVVHMMSTRSGSTHCRSVDPEDTVDIPMMQDEGRLVLDRVTSWSKSSS